MMGFTSLLGTGLSSVKTGTEFVATDWILLSICPSTFQKIKIDIREKVLRPAVSKPLYKGLSGTLPWVAKSRKSTTSLARCVGQDSNVKVVPTLKLLTYAL